MIKRLNKLYFLVPLLYIGIILFLLFLQFSKGRSFSESFGGIRIQGVMEMEEKESETLGIEQLSLEYQGIVFDFNSRQSLEFIGTDGAIYRARITDYQQIADGYELIFPEEVRLGFQLSGIDKQDLQIIPRLPEGMANIQRIRVPFKLNGKSRTEFDEDARTLGVLYNEQHYELVVPENSEIQVGKQNFLSLAKGQTKNTALYVKTVTADPERESWYDRKDIQVDDEAFRDEKRAFLQRAYAGWRDSRYNSETSEWRKGPEYAVFDEKILTALLAESWNRENYNRVYNEMRSAADRHPGQLTELSSPFLGDMETVWREAAERDRRESRRMEAHIREDNYEIFRRQGLLEFAADRAEMLDELIDFIDSVDIDKLDLFSGIWLLYNILTVNPAFEAELASRFARFEGLIDSLILKSIVELNEGFFLEAGTGFVDMFYSALAGKVMILAGERNGNQLVTALGQQLLRAVFEQADGSGLFPAELRTGGSEIRNRSGILGPEDIYFLLHEETAAYPKHISLYHEAGAGCWIHTITDFIEVETNADEYFFRLINIPNQTHHIAVHDPGAFNSMELFGVVWRDDPNFEYYPKGRHYSADLDILMIKYTDDLPQGVIRINFE
jgi:hypothetical protein